MSKFKKSLSNFTNSLIIRKVTLALCLFCAALSFTGVTYSWFKGAVTGTPKDVKATTASLSIVYNDGNAFTANDLFPGDSVTKTFTIENTGEGRAMYKINWATITNNMGDKTDFTYTLTSTNGGGSLSSTQIPNTTTHSNIVSNISIDPGVIQTYTMTFYFKNDTSNQDDNRGKSITGKLEVIEQEVSNTVPNTYQKVEYLRSTGTQYIDTGYYWKSEAIEMILDGKVITNSSAQSLFGNEEYTSSSNTRNFAGIPHGTNGTYSMYVGSGSQFSVSLGLNTRFLLDVKTNTSKLLQVYKNGSLVNSSTYSGSVITKDTAYLTSSASTNVGNVFLYANHNSNRGSTNAGTQIIGKMEVYSFKMYENGNLVRDFVPCYRKSDSVRGLYDLAGSKFYTNAGTGTFEIGSNVN